jgi:hypothetical protein
MSIYDVSQHIKGGFVAHFSDVFDFELARECEITDG